MQSFFRIIAFFITFGVGAGTLTLSVLCGDLEHFYFNKQLVAKEKQQLASLQEKVKVYDALLVNLITDPDLVHRITPAVLGVRTDDPNTAYPLTGVKELAAASQVFEGDKNEAMPTMPAWLIRCCEEKRQKALFLAGGVLVLIAFSCFGLVKAQAKDE
jgi:hypothetical protein